MCQWKAAGSKVPSQTLLLLLLQASGDAVAAAARSGVLRGKGSVQVAVDGLSNDVLGKYCVSSKSGSPVTSKSVVSANAVEAVA
jgi:hypothetical protein